MGQTRNNITATTADPTAATVPSTAPATSMPLKGACAAATPPSIKAAKSAKTFRSPTIKGSLAVPTNPLMAQFVRDMQVAGHCAGTQHAYLDAVQRFIQITWISPIAATEEHFQDYLLTLRARDVAGETFRVQRFALQFLFQNTLGYDWALFKKN